MAFTRVGDSFKLNQIFIIIVFCSILPLSHLDLYSEAFEDEFEDESFSASISRKRRATDDTYVASGINQIGYCGINSFSVTNRRKRTDDEPQGNHDWPWMAAILNVDGFLQFCGGTLLNRQYVLTAAHCFKEPGSEKTVDDVIIRLGEYNTSDYDETKHQEIFAKTIEVHESYDPATKLNDIALIKLAKSVNYDQYTRPLCLPTLEPKANETTYVAGWGATKSGGQPSRILLDVAIPVVDYTSCEKLHTHEIDKDKNLCAGKYSKDSCQGDSGGPLIYQEQTAPKRWMIVGIVSWGMSCGDYQPGVYTHVQNYMDWIKNRVGDAQI